MGPIKLELVKDNPKRSDRFRVTLPGAMHMPTDNIAVRLRHMLDAAREAVGFCGGRTRADLGSDEVLALALQRLLVIIGEAAGRVPAEYREREKVIPWDDFVTICDRLIEEYANVDLDVVWNTVTARLPGVIRELEMLLPPEKA